MSTAKLAYTRIYAWFTAVMNDDTPLMADLMAHGFPVDTPHPLRHSTALMEATRLGRAEMVRGPGLFVWAACGNLTALCHSSPPLECCLHSGKRHAKLRRDGRL
jgi:hypothetical protein